ncbi:androgen-induced gene 1 protein-like isoform X2 [Eriocheir sinensis]|uniref:androgen-induced gene 1 protein-like isoform X2 n=1 Tax=Eriocheir sinensis TaxID=95602 RepID=UPI0021C93A46|nr:androgen-induced gene 1 protein-like isoform X2 [Eriocheir sinensis]XP_050692962.1 androgen-induced gene 1 protein-like isoform X2 [Eriocheir sinensis]XP_050692963.1 androgen-induced gene 1 protein-like isoform X2 [Eriocheir sinensis]XP_050692964.1 androgen-induced gene 1 protein-like isoform X2 [Eriocheir sinensis]XP_050692965.1 androgen-induced gene 1 protein-like isoform X2 [Eriocheir sinensis]XP_050692966.1 androgen-induced gene 1 protein-like isoform X2 [Eriocheir sinensis]XP_05069296
MDVVQKGFHAVTFLVYSYGLYSDHYKVAIPPTSTSYLMTFHVIGGRWKYLTYITLVLQCVFFGLCALNDFLGSETLIHNKRSFLQKLRDVLLPTVVLPLGVFVPLIFWGLYAVDRELIFPVSMDAWFPGWLNHLMHTLPFFASIIEIIVTNHVYPKGGMLYFPIVVASALYIFWLCFIAHHTGFWVYPVFEVLDFKSRALFMASLVPPNLLFVFLGQKLHLGVWGTVKGASKRRGKKDKSQ